MTAKEEKIREAYGEYWESVKEYIIDNGWCTVRRHILFDKIIKNIEIEIGGYQWRPKSLQGIEKNNGWIKIESEGDLPKDELDCFFIKDSLIYTGLWDNRLKRFYSGSEWITKITHYQPIQKPKQPIY